MPLSGAGRAAKRALDLAIAVPALIVLSPLLLLLALMVLLTMGRPIFFLQQRPGRGGQPFTVIKIRTMLPATGTKVDPSSDGRRLTSVGRLLRRWSLDELPQLVSVIKGEMSLVGPRPLLMEYLDYYTPEQGRRHEVRPGLTGWAQVNGRNALTWEEKLRLDVWYVDHVSLWLDLRILVLTMCKVFRGEGVVAAGNAMMPESFGKFHQQE